MAGTLLHVQHRAVADLPVPSITLAKERGEARGAGGVPRSPGGALEPMGCQEPRRGEFLPHDVPLLGSLWHKQKGARRIPRA